MIKRACALFIAVSLFFYHFSFPAVMPAFYVFVPPLKWLWLKLWNGCFVNSIFLWLPCFPPSCFCMASYITQFTVCCHLPIMQVCVCQIISGKRLLAEIMKKILCAAFIKIFSWYLIHADLYDKMTSCMP